MKKKPMKPRQTRQAIFEKINWINQLRKLSSFDDELVSDLLQVAALTGNQKLFSVIEDILTPLAQEQLIRPHPFKKAPAPELSHDGIYIGEIISGEGYSGKLMIPLVSLVLHALIAGTTGAGKSYLIKLMVAQLIARGITVIIFDSENEFRDLLTIVGPDKILIFDALTLRDNFLEMPFGVSPKEWLALLCNLTREAFFCRDGSINMLRTLLHDIYRSRGIFSGSEDYPNLLDLVKLLRSTEFKSKQRFSGYLESLQNRFNGLLDALGDTLCCKRGYDMTKEQGKLIIISTAGLSDDIRNFLVNLKMLREAASARRFHPQGLRTIVVIEEAHKLLNEWVSTRSDLGEPMIVSVSRFYRKLGIGLIFSDQVPSALPAPVLANTSNKFVLRIVHGSCIRKVSMAMNLKPEQSECLPILPERQCIFQSGFCPEPVLIEIPDLCFKQVTDEEIKTHMEPILKRLDYTPAEETAAIELSTGMSSFGQNRAGKSKPNELWRRILKTVAEKAPVSLREIYEECDINHFQGRKILETMEKQDLIETCAVGFGARGNPKTFVVLKPKGAEFIGLDFEDVKLKGKGDTEHVILQNLLAQAMRNSGKTVSIEYYANGKSVDIAEIGDDRSIAYEIELAPAHPHVAENVRKDFAAGFSQVVVITQNKACQVEAKNRIVAEIEWEKLSKVEFKLPKDFLKKSTSPEGEGKRKPHTDLSRMFPSLSFILPFLWLILSFFLLQQDFFGSNTNHLHGLMLPHIPAFATGRNPDKRYAYDGNSEVVDVLLNRDLNLLCRIGKMRKKQIREREDRRKRIWRKKAIKESCLASQRKVAHLREVLKSEEVRL